jgi:hypothetical protein
MKYTDQGMIEKTMSFFVNCENCDRKLESSCSKPDRGRLILPVEFSGFIPIESWLDPMYLDIWQNRGWLHKGTIQP